MTIFVLWATWSLLGLLYSALSVRKELQTLLMNMHGCVLAGGNVQNRQYG